MDLSPKEIKQQRDFCFSIIEKIPVFKDLWIRNFHGYQNYIQITGDANSGKSWNACFIYYLMSLGMYGYVPTFEDCYFRAIDINSKITQISNRCIMNNEAGGRGKFWNDKQNEAWDNILQQQRIKKNTYIDCLPHRKQVSGTTNIFINYLMIMENYLVDYLKKPVKNNEIDLKNIESYEIKRVVKVYKYEKDYLGFNPNAIQNYFVIPHFYDYYILPDFNNDKRFKILKKFLEEYREFDIKEKERLAKISEDKSTGRDKLMKKTSKNILLNSSLSNF